MRVVAAFVVLAIATESIADDAGGGTAWRVARSVPTGSMPWAVVVSPDGASLYVTHVGNKHRDNVRRYDTATLTVAARAHFAGHAVEAVLDADARTLYVTNSRRHEVLALDAETLSVRKRYRTGKIPKDLRLAPGGSHIYVAEYGASTVSRIDVASGARTTVAVGRRPRGVALSADGTSLFVGNMGSHTISVVDASTMKVTATWRACRAPRHIVAMRDERVLVTCLGSRHVLVIDSESGHATRTVRVGRGPKTLGLTSDEAFAVTADERSNTATVIDLATYATKQVPLAADQPCGLAISPDDRRIYVTARGTNDLLILDNGTAQRGLSVVH